MIALAGLLAAALLGLPRLLLDGEATVPGTEAVRNVLRERADNAGFDRVTGPRTLAFPQDHGAHPGYRHEWWYVTGHLRSPGHSDRGFQLTFFRYGLVPGQPSSTSRWRSHQWVLAHFAVSDPETGKFHHEARQSRAALELAGFTEPDARLWLDDWQLARDATHDNWTLSATTSDASLRLRLTPTKPLVLQGDRGYSAKSSEPGNASHYYSLPRLLGRGQLRVEGEVQDVEAEAWLDHEWGTSGLGATQAGWDWFALQLQDGRELTFYRLRGREGGTDSHSRGLLVRADGGAEPLGHDAVRLRPLRWWTSPTSGLRYPVAWEVELPAESLALRLEPLFDAQEWARGLRYWEGAVRVHDVASGATLGQGYLELTGYGPP